MDAIREAAIRSYMPGLGSLNFGRPRAPGYHRVHLIPTEFSSPWGSNLSNEPISVFRGIAFLILLHLVARSNVLVFHSTGFSHHHLRSTHHWMVQLYYNNNGFLVKSRMCPPYPQRVSSACTSMCRHIYDWNIVNCDVKQPIQLNSNSRKLVSNINSFYVISISLRWS